MGFRKFLISKLFFKHLALSVAGGVLVVWLSIQMLDFYTSHGEAIEVPQMTGLQLNELNRVDPKGNFRFVVIDSVFDERYERGAIFLQDPPPGSRVKSGRKIYLTVVATQPETVKMPDLVDLSLRQALSGIRSAGLKVERLEYVSNMAKNAVLAQKFERQEILPGTEILKGSAIELVLGKGLHDEKADIPDLFKKTDSEAFTLIHQSSLNIGLLIYSDPMNKENARVYRQSPSAGRDGKADFGAFIDLWLTSDPNFNFEAYRIANPEDSISQEIEEEIIEEDIF